MAVMCAYVHLCVAGGAVLNGDGKLIITLILLKKPMSYASLFYAQHGHRPFFEREKGMLANHRDLSNEFEAQQPKH